ncbi:hypothetical protein [Psychroserpens ponticola]|uniref:Uncharacterized protein n=1 Tax=Psychroserpens ponticola TaxID=2932268 RepID=A0ABY7RUB7_9FLAO|nr:hypothetical protein [Psychroserpens ponticola]WCO00275.1 hypothetical protein MUN68_009335 [Psychroserpens ponticola]
MKTLITKYKKRIVQFLVFLIIVATSYYTFNKPVKYSATFIGSTNLGFVDYEYFNQRTEDNIESSLMNKNNPYLDENKMIIHLQFISYSKDIKNLEINIPNAKNKFEICYGKNINLNDAYKTEFNIVNSGYHNLNSINIGKNEKIDVWIIANLKNQIRTDELFDIRNYYFLVNNKQVVDINQTLTYFEKIGSFRYKVINYIIYHPMYQILICLIVIYALYIIIFKFKFSDIGSIIKNKKSHINKIGSLIILYFTFFITVYQFFITDIPNEHELEIFSVEPLYIPTIPTIDFTPEDYRIAYLQDSLTGEIDYETSMVIPTSLKIDTIYNDYSYINKFIFGSKSNFRVPELTILSVSGDNTYYSGSIGGLKTTKKIADTIASLKGFEGQNNFKLFSKKPICDCDLRFHTTNRVYTVTHKSKDIVTFNFIDRFLTESIINNIWIQLFVMFLIYFGLINIMMSLWKKIKNICQQRV